MQPPEGELEFVKGLAVEVAAIARGRCRTVTPREKDNQSFVTDLDDDLERLIRDRLARAFPDDALTGEELAREGGSGPRRWSIDPIDGTGNLVHALPLWAISIGLLDAGEPVLGVVAIPPLNELYWATKGGGAFLDGRRLEARDSDDVHVQDNIGLGTNAMRAIDPRSFPGRLRNLGSACCELVFVAGNRLQATASLGEQAHDLAASCLIAAEAGCRFGTLDGRLLTPAALIASTPIAVPTFTAPPRRLAHLMAEAKRLE